MEEIEGREKKETEGEVGTLIEQTLIERGRDWRRETGRRGETGETVGDRRLQEGLQPRGAALSPPPQRSSSLLSSSTEEQLSCPLHLRGAALLSSPPQRRSSLLLLLRGAATPPRGALSATVCPMCSVFLRCHGERSSPWFGLSPRCRVYLRGGGLHIRERERPPVLSNPCSLMTCVCTV